MPLSLAEVLEEEYRALYPDDADGPHALTWELTVGQIADPRALIETLHVRWPPLAAELWSELTPATQAAVAACYDAGAAPDASLLGALVEELNAIALRPQPTGGVRRLYDARKYQFLETPLSSDLRRLGAMKLEGDDAIHFNRLLLEETFRPEVTRPGAIRPIHEVRLAEVYAAVHERAAQGRPRTALCLSGGGIRSATYALGVV